jgi:hypothetical protein
LFDRVSAFALCSASVQGPEVVLGGWNINCRVQIITMASNAFGLNSDGAMIRLAEETTNQNAAFSNINPTPLGRLQQRQHILHPRVFSTECTPLSTSNGSPQCPPSSFAAFRVADRQIALPMLSHFQTSQDLKLMRVAALVRVFPAIAAFPPARAVRNEEQGVMHLDPCGMVAWTILCTSARVRSLRLAQGTFTPTQLACRTASNKCSIQGNR